MNRAIRMLALVAFAVPGVAGAQILNFEGIGNPNTPFVPIGNFYSGGGGPNFGITFSSNALRICLTTPARPQCSNGSRGGLGNPDSRNGGLVFQFGSLPFMNSSAGFTTGFSFFYSAIFQTAEVQVRSGLNGTGSILASLILPTTPLGGSLANCQFRNFCPFVAAGVAFAGTAQSVAFAGTAPQIVLDDVTFGSAIPDVDVEPIPEPASLVLLATGLVGIGGIVRRRRKG